MSDTKIEIYYTKTGILIKIALFVLYVLRRLPSYSVKSQKYKILLTTKLDRKSKLILIRQLFFFMNVLEINKIKTTY
jgi:hypothetical protein